jgi:Arc/MetJ-type ribon-helix-helix transcriptional regulator
MPSNVYTYVDEERREEIEEAVEEGGWNSLADYVRTMMRAGENNFAELDPRSSDGSNAGEKRVSNAELRSELSDEFQHVDEVINDLVEDFKADLRHRMKEMERDDAYPVESDGAGNYRIEE